MRTTEEWSKIESSRNDYQLAAFVLQDLVGYNPTCRFKEDDIKSLMNLIGFLRDQD